MGSTHQAYSATERLGVNAVERVILLFNWIFREQHVADHGIDAEVEVCDDGRPTGRLLKLQIKSGTSWFAEQTVDGIVFRDSAQHFEYWFDYSVPVVVTLYDPTINRTWWQHIVMTNAERTGVGYKIIVPHHQIFTPLSAPALRAIAGRPLQRQPVEMTSMLTTIDRATKSVDVATPHLGPALLDALLNVAGRSRVRIVIDDSDRQTADSLRHADASGLDFEIRLQQDLHLKQIVVDERVAIYGSSVNPETSMNLEIVLETTNRKLVRSMADAFAHLWGLARSPDV